MIQKLFRQITTTQILSSMTNYLCLLIDSIVVGRLLGVNAMSAYGIATPLLTIYTALGLMLVNGANVPLGQAIGRGDREGTNTCYSTSITMAMLLAIMSILLIFTAGDPLCSLLGAPEGEVFVLTRDYLRGYMLGAPFFFLSQLLNTYLQTIGKRKRVTCSVIAMIVVNVIGDLLSVFLFHGSMFGIGLVSSLSYLASCMVSFGGLVGKDSFFRFGRISPHVFIEILRAGNWVLLNQAFVTVRTLVYNLLLIKLGGTVAVAAFAVYTTLTNLMYTIGIGAGSTTLILSSIFYGEEDRDSIHSLVSAMLLHTLTLTVSVILFSEIMATWLLQLFLGSDLPDMAVLGFRLFLISMIPNMLINVFKMYFSGIKHTKINSLIAFLQHIGLNISFVWLFSRLFGLTGLWIGATMGQFAALLFIAIICWRKYGRVSFSPAAVSYLDKDFGAKPEDCTTLTVSDIPSAVSTSQTLCAFCEQKGLSPRNSMLIGLCVEEITINIIKHGFIKDGHPHNIDVRLVAGANKNILRIRDNCMNFDPTDYFKLHQDTDPAAHIGLRMVMRIVKEARYINTLGLNNLTLVL